MKFKSLITISALIALFAISCNAEPPGYCKNNDISSVCAGGAPHVKAQAGEQGICETYDSECLVEKLNCLRYRNGEPCKYILQVFY